MSQRKRDDSPPTLYLTADKSLSNRRQISLREVKLLVFATCVPSCTYPKGWTGSLSLCPLVFSCTTLKGHSHLCDCADLDASFSHFEKSLPQPKIKVHLEVLFIFRSVLLDFQSFPEKPVFECPFAHPMILFYHIWLKTVFIAPLLYAN